MQKHRANTEATRFFYYPEMSFDDYIPNKLNFSRTGNQDSRSQFSQKECMRSGKCSKFQQACLCTLFTFFQAMKLTCIMNSFIHSSNVQRSRGKIRRRAGRFWPWKGGVWMFRVWVWSRWWESGLHWCIYVITCFYQQCAKNSCHIFSVFSCITPPLAHVISLKHCCSQISFIPRLFQISQQL